MRKERFEIKMEYLYESTRDRKMIHTASEAVLKGLAEDGGLFVMRNLEHISLDVKALMKQDYLGMAQQVLGKLLPDISSEDMERCVRAAYEGRFESREVTPLVKVGRDWVLELFHGPTCAFKDVALQILPRLMTVSKEMNGDLSETVILTATSGDTGKAALEGFRDVAGTKIIVFYPESGVSAVQKAQMVTQQGSNVYVCGIKGDFDDAQTGVKRIFSDKSIEEALQKQNQRFSSANSINIGRLAPQVVYYFYAYKRLMEKCVISYGDRINFVVPTGNFGDIFAGKIAKMLGLPINKLICASNSNNVLFDFITTGCYDRKRLLEKTISPSMDILVSSNLERLLYYASGKDNELISRLMKSLAEEGRYTVPAFMLEAIQRDFCAGYADDAMTKVAIERCWDECGYLLDTHTGVAMSVLRDYQMATADDTPTVVLSTASPYKFSTSVFEAIYGENAAKKYGDEYRIMNALQEKTGIAIPKPLADLQSRPVIHNAVCEKEKMSDFVLHCTAEK